MTQRRLTREEQRAQTRQELLDAAAAVFARHGYHAASVDDVAEAAGFTKGAVYSNFESKEALFLALYTQHVDRAVDIAEHVLEAPPEDRGDAVVAARDEMDLWSRDWHLLETEFLLYAARNDSMRELVAEHQEKTQERVTEMAAMHLADVGASAEHAEDFARLIIGALDGLATQSLIDGEDHGHLAGLLIDTMTQGLGARGGADGRGSA